MLYKKTLRDRMFDSGNTIFMLLVIFATMFPIWYILVGSLNNGSDYMRGGIYFWPRIFTFDNYLAIIRHPLVVSAFKVTLARTVLGTIGTLLVSSLFAYAFSRKELIGKKVYGYICLIPMFLTGGLIPFYLVLYWVGLIDNFLVFIIPTLFSFWYVLIFKSFFEDIPASMIESARIDGANEYHIFFRMIVPVSKPVFAAIALFVGVEHWNSFFDSMVYTSSENLITLQNLLMKIIRNSGDASNMAKQMSGLSSQHRTVTAASVQLATMMFVSLPVLILYPFLQRYFVSGLMLGSTKE